MNSIGLNGVSAAMLAVATQIPSEFVAFNLTSTEYQCIMVAVAFVLAIAKEVTDFFRGNNNDEKK
jgi:hypothetical protein